MNDTVKIRKAYSYQRFSSARQRAGDSLRRQSQATDTFISEHRLTLVDTFIDKGVSAFRGKNFSDEAALGQFIKLVEKGTVEKNCVLVVESMDRLSRDIILPCFNKFIEMINSDIEIGVLSLNKIFNKKSITANPMELMLVLVEFARANNESEVKSKRSKSVISSKIERMKKGEKFYGLGKPYWVTGLKDGKFVLDNDKVTLVMDIFQRYLAGNAATKIASQLNAEAVPTLRGIKRFVWSSVSVLQLLRNKNVIGIMSINGNVIENYYPQIIGEKSFQLVQQKLTFNHSNRGGSVNDYVNNLFKGLLFCSDCGKTIEVKIAWYKPINGEVKQYFTYCCSGVHRGTKCLNKGRILVSKFETNFFDFIFMAKINQVNVTKTENVKLISLENELAKLDMRIERTVKILQNDELSDMAELLESLKSLKKEQATLKKDIMIEKANTVSKDNAPHAVKSLLELKQRDTLGTTVTDIEERKKARNLMPSLYRKVTLKFGEKDTTAIFYGLDGNTDKMTLKK